MRLNGFEAFPDILRLKPVSKGAFVDYADLTQLFIFQKLRAQSRNCSEIEQVSSGKPRSTILNFLSKNLSIRHDLYRPVAFNVHEFGLHINNRLRCQIINLANTFYETSQVVRLFGVPADRLSNRIVQAWRKVGEILHIAKEEVDVPTQAMLMAQHQNCSATPSPI